MSKPLEGVRVLDLTWALSGPYATMLLADLGAEVIKVEIPEKGDFARQNGPFIEDVSIYFLSLNRGKKSVTLNLKDSRDRTIFLDLVKDSDVVIENFRPGTMERLGLNYEVLQQQNPSLIYAACSGFGTDNPDSSRGAYDIIIQAMAGTMSVNGHADGPPTRVGFSIGDIAGGLYCALAIVAALVERTRSGVGQAIEISLFNAQLAMLENAFARYFATKEIPERLGSRHPAIATFGAFRTADGYIAMAAATDDQWHNLCHALDRPDLLQEERFSSNELRRINRKELEQILVDTFAGRNTAEWIKRLEQRDVPYGPVNDISQVAESPQFKDSGMAVVVEHPRLGDLQILGSPMRFSRTPLQIKQAAPDLGQHTEEILARLLNSDQIER